MFEEDFLKHVLMFHGDCDEEPIREEVFGALSNEIFIVKTKVIYSKYR